jgi:hypothetical protein
VFAANLLTNPGFEDGTTGWSKYGGDLQTTSSQIHSGSISASLVSITQSTKWIYQIVSITGGLAYTLSGYGLKNDSIISSVLFRIAWYSSSDGSGSELKHNDSDFSLTDNDSNYKLLSTGSIVAPDDANSARVKAVASFASGSQAYANFDDINFEQTALPTPVPTHSPTNTSTPIPTSSLTPSPTRTPTRANSPTPTPTPDLSDDVLSDSTDSAQNSIVNEIQPSGTVSASEGMPIKIILIPIVSVGLGLAILSGVLIWQKRNTSIPPGA